MHHVQIAFLNYVKQTHAHFGHELDAWKLAHQLGLIIVTGDENCLRGNLIFLRGEDRYSRRAPGIIRHEIAHYLMKQSGTEGRIYRLRCSREAGLPTIENLVYHAALMLQIPEGCLARAQGELGNTPQAIVRIAQLAEAPVVDALHRWVYAEVGAQRAAWITRGRTVTESASANLWLPFWRYSEVDGSELPNALLHPLCQRETLGMVLGA